MKNFLLIFLVLFCSVGFADKSWTYHKTESGKYPHYYADAPGDTPWDDEDQKKYDEAVDQAISQLCLESEEVRRAQATLDNEKQVGKATGYVDATAIHDAGSQLVSLKSKIEPLAKIIKDETGKDASSYPCE